jgi:hypothetical protein
VDITKHDDDVEDPNDESEQRPELRGGGDSEDYQRFHPRRRANFESVKHRLSPITRADTEDCFDCVATLNPSWVRRSTTLWGQLPLTTAAVAQHSNLNANLVVTLNLRTRIER